MTLRLSRATIASTVGTALEWYDFSLYGTAAALVLPLVFFPSGDPVAATLSSLATFAVGFFARPVGGIVIGVLGDRVGRRTMLFVTLLLMAVASTLIGLLPSYAAVGPAAPIMLVALRVVQGLGAGGEYAGAMLMSAEHAETRSRGLNASAPTLGNAVGSLVATGVFFLVSALMPHEAFVDYGWRIPFLLSVLVGVAGVIVRLKVSDTPEFREARDAARDGGGPAQAPLRALFATSRHKIVPGMLISVAPNVISYLPSVYALTYLTTHVHTESWVGLMGVVIANLVKIVTVPAAGLLCDRFGRRPVMVAGSVAAAVLFYPFFFMLDTGTPVVIWAAFVMIFTLCNDLTLASQATMMSELFDVRYRYTGVTFTREIAGAIVGGCIPFVAAWLDDWSGGQTWPIVVVSALLCLLSALGTRFISEPAHLRRPVPARAAG
ncbi:MHS family MFS transporter [Actinomadura sp. ATCC 31491]|uniref:MHS family MFS transporter n=1 Tax=Actinomadura luzonensis TaxID=2805427 RepID=A0ABT0FN74_9ACTN|nr:MFS transporter [Actinomadura luzonensis]MCK2213752.1 MHS family MFS transporter [Actinomadura luzonensis]